MIKILTESPINAWMIDRDSVIYDIKKAHPIGEGTIEDADWLLSEALADNDNITKFIIMTLIKDIIIDTGYADDSSMKFTKEDFMEEYDYLYPDNSLSRSTRELIEDSIDKNNLKYAEDYEKLFTSLSKGIGYNKLSDYVKDYLNNNFLRIRRGGNYDTLSTSRLNEYYFRISSNGYNWYNNILDFLMNNKSVSLKNVVITIQKDPVTTGEDTVYANHISFDDFISRKIYIESLISDSE